MPSTDTKSRQTIAETPARALAFISAVSTTSSIREALETRGYDAETHAAYWQLLLRFAGYEEGPSAPSLDERARQAAQEISAWQEPNFRIARAALRHDHIDAHEFIFTGLDASRGIGTLVAVVTFLDKLDALEHSPDRKKTRKGDLAALAKLAGRGITREERDRLRRLQALAMRAPGLGPEADPVKPDGTEPLPEDERQMTLMQLHGMYEEWAEVARVVLRRRADLIRLGLVKRRRAVKTGRGPIAASGSVVITQVPTPLGMVGLLPPALVSHTPAPTASPALAAPTPAAPAKAAADTQVAPAEPAAHVDAAPAPAAPSPAPAGPLNGAPESPLNGAAPASPAPFSQGAPSGGLPS